MKGNLHIHIPQPCHEDWQKMTPTQQGRFCQSCAKQVVNFSLMTDQQVLNYFANNSGKLCGRFAADQLQRPLQPVKQEKKKWWWVAAMMPLLLFFTKSSAQKKDSIQQVPAVIDLERSVAGMVDYTYEREQRRIHKKNPMVTQITVERQKGNPRYVVSGRLVAFRSNDPIPFADVSIKGCNTMAIADADGYFKLQGDTTTNRIQLSVAAIGFMNKEVTVVLKDTGAGPAENYLNIKGRVVDKHNGHGIPLATVSTSRSNQPTAITDADGYFSLHYTAYDDTIILTAKGVDYYEGFFSYKNAGDNIVIKCKKNHEKWTDIVNVGGYTICTKSVKTDTFPALMQRVFLPQPFKIFPNPAPRGSTVNIQLKEEADYSIQLFDNIGKLLQATEFNANKSAMQTSIIIPSSASAGVYYVRLINAQTKKEYTSKILVL